MHLRLVVKTFGTALLITLILPVTAAARQLTETSIAAMLDDPALVSTMKKDFPVHTVAQSGANVDGAPRRFLIQGGLHGNEARTSEFVLWLAKRMAAGKSLLNKIPGNIAVDFLPYANPDSYGHNRYNANQVNLNRNFGVLWGVSREPHGDKAFSEPETKAIRSLMSSRRYLSAIDVHGYINWIVTPSGPSRVGQDSPEQRARYNLWMAAAKDKAAALPGYKVKSAGDLGDGGAFEDWAFWKNRSFSVCLEMQSRSRYRKNAAGRIRDTWLGYERFIFDMFQSALKIDKGLDQAPALTLRNATASRTGT